MKLTQRIVGKVLLKVGLVLSDFARFASLKLWALATGTVVLGARLMIEGETE